MENEIELIVAKHRQTEESKTVVIKFNEALLSGDFDAVRNLVADDLNTLPGFIHDEIVNLRKYQDEFVHRITGENNRVLLDHANESVEREVDVYHEGKRDWISILRLGWQYENERFELLDIIAEGEMVWSTVKSTAFPILYKKPVESLIHGKFQVRGGKIISFLNFKHHLIDFMQLGKLKLSHGDQESIAEYMGMLRDLEIIS
ncbi:MAG: hypothetical protein ACXAE3_05365 [Candidatus Kariarchaeaceae archaeon]